MYTLRRIENMRRKKKTALTTLWFLVNNLVFCDLFAFWLGVN
jgi:hypothetical protein